MTSDRWGRIDELVKEALARTEREREAFLREACGGDAALHDEVKSLLKHVGSAEEFLESPIEPSQDSSEVARSVGTTTLVPGTLLGRYRIVEKIGAGGMGEVYRATDPRVDRAVAIKILPGHFGDDGARRARFEREARAIGSLNHPNICTLFDVGEHGGYTFLVMELVEGETLARRIAKRAIPLEDALRHGIEIAGALDRAHRQGIVHRDLKPANIMITKAGVKLLDFGLAKFKTTPPAEGSALPTRSVEATAEGTILGTLQYMSPEQLEGREADARSDIFALGAVLYEMITGSKAFEGTSHASLTSAILRDQPPAMATLQPLAPVALDRVVRTCLEKDPDNRWQSAADLGRELRWSAHELGSVGAAVETGANAGRAGIGRRKPALWIAAGVLIGAAVGSFAWSRFSSPTPSAISGAFRVELNLPATDRIAEANALPLAFSPDGTQVAYVGFRAGVRQLFLRALNEKVPRPLARTDDARLPCFSPDGDWIGFMVGSKLKKAAVNGAGVLTICDECMAGGIKWVPYGLSWGTDGFLYVGRGNGGIYRVHESGGTLAEVTKLDRTNGETSHREPVVLAANDVLLFTALKGPSTDAAEIVRQSLSTGERDVLVRGGHTAQFLNDGYLVYAREGDLLARPWRPWQKKLSNAAVSLGEHPLFGSENVSAYRLSNGGALAYVDGGADWLPHRLVWVDRHGNTEPIPQPARNYQDLAISPDGQQVIVTLGGGAGLWKYDIARNSFTGFVTTGEGSQVPVWTADRLHVIYRATRNGLRNLYRKRADGTGEEEALTHNGATQTPESVTRDGRVLFTQGPDKIFALDLRNLTTQLIVERGSRGQVTPDGKFVAYQANLSAPGGSPDVYVQPFSSNADRIPVSSGGGASPRWSRTEPRGSRSSRELFYRSGDDLMAVDISTAPFAVGKPQRLFSDRFRRQGGASRLYDVAPDGRFLFEEPVQSAPPLNRIQVVLNWAAEVRKAVGK